MAKQRKTKLSTKRKIAREAGNKCANPGCSNWRTHIHHIEKWAIYESDDEKILIAVCPSCHDAIHHGYLSISDDTLYRWKNIIRDGKRNRSYIYIEPGGEVKILGGSVAFATTNEKLIIFQLSESSKLEFTVQDEEIMLLACSIKDLNKKEIVRVKNNHLRLLDEEIVLDQVPGHVRVSAKSFERFMSENLLSKIKLLEPKYGANGCFDLLDIEVLSPGFARIKGVWAEDKIAVVITNNALGFLDSNRFEPAIVTGDRENTVIKVTGAITHAMFGFNGF